jgi:hypothetical protein
MFDHAWHINFLGPKVFQPHVTSLDGPYDDVATLSCAVCLYVWYVGAYSWVKPEDHPRRHTAANRAQSPVSPFVPLLRT